jgi:5-methyltetrahydropteroyltriglutamate--homocysteine methyltransferase
MTKWFDTNYHYLVPELEAAQIFRIASDKLFEEVSEAQAAGFNPKPVLLGPLSYLHLAKCKGDDFDRLDLLPALLNVYKDILTCLLDLGVEWVQVDEPILVLDLVDQWRQAFEMAYNQL